jgi:hypothetical protein
MIIWVWLRSWDGDDFFIYGWHPHLTRIETVWDGYFLLPAGIRYFTIAIILNSKQVKIYLFCYIFLLEVHFVILTMTCFDC